MRVLLATCLISLMVLPAVCGQEDEVKADEPKVAISENLIINPSFEEPLPG